MNKIFIISEIGINHNGDLDIAKKLIDVAKESGADAVKFQKRTIDIVYDEEMLDGHIWELNLTSNTGRSKKVWGQHTYPENFNDLIKALNNLFETKIDV